MCLLRLLILDECEDLITVNVVAALVDDGAADLTDQHDQAGGGVVAGGVFPDQEDYVHDGYEQVWDFGEVLACVGQLVEQVS